MAKLRVRAALSAIAAGILITIGGCTEQAPTSNSGPETSARYQRLELRQDGGAAFDVPVAEKVIGKEGGTLEIFGGHTLTFPAGALTEPTRIRAKVDTRYIEVDLEPHGITFPSGREPVLRMSYAAAATPVLADRLTIIYLEGARLVEDMGGRAEAGKEIVTARLPHFSRYAISTNL
ncbi:MAG TPA: hypothetical protein VF615_09360 [Longimicrobiaceae bacterium]|jgi:hypothetical protein